MYMWLLVFQMWKEAGGVVVGTAVEDHYSHSVHRYEINQPTLLIVGGYSGIQVFWTSLVWMWAFML